MDARWMAAVAQAEEFDWDAANAVKSVIKHRVSCQEAEQVFKNRPLMLLEDVVHSHSEHRFKAFGQSDAHRQLIISFTLRERKIRVISARSMNRKEKTWYAKQSQA